MTARNKAAIVAILAALLAGGCMCYGPITVNVLSSRMVQANGTNTVQQATEGGAVVSSNALTAPLKGIP